MRKKPARSLFGEDLRRLPGTFAFVRKDSPGIGSAPDVEFSLVAGAAIQCPVVAWLAAVSPLCAAFVTINSPGIVITSLHPRPIVRPGHCVQRAVMNDQRTDTGRAA